MMRDFLEGLEQNADRIISEAEEGGSSGSGQTFAQVSQGVKWGYIPQPKGASTSDADSGKGGFGSAKNSLLFIKENSPDSWDIVVMKYGRGGSLATDDDRAAFAAMRKRPSKSSEEDSSAKTDEAREITRYMALAEQVLNGKVLNEVAAGNVEGWTEMLKDTNWKSSKVIGGLKFADLLEKCVAVVSPDKGGAKSFLS